MGVTYKGGVQSYHGITDNLTGLKSSFKYNNGYFGDKGTSSQVRVIYGNDPVNIGKDFYKKISFGGIEKDLDNGKGKISSVRESECLDFLK